MYKFLYVMLRLVCCVLWMQLVLWGRLFFWDTDWHQYVAHTFWHHCMTNCGTMRKPYALSSKTPQPQQCCTFCNGVFFVDGIISGDCAPLVHPILTFLRSVQKDEVCSNGPFNCPWCGTKHLW